MKKTLITRYFTFGQNHIHKIDGVIYDKDSIVKITAVDPRARMFELFGSEWCWEYTSLDEIKHLELFSRGVVNID